MKANEFVKKFGIEKAKQAVGFGNKYAENGLLRLETFDGDEIDVVIDDLKRLVESHELVEKYKNRHGGVRFRIRWGMFRYNDTQEFNDRLKQAILDVESCQ